jgi:hypothetical protein
VAAKTVRRKGKHRIISAQRRIDVTRFEHQTLLDLVERNREAVQRLEVAMAIQFKRTVELQAEIDTLKRTSAMGGLSDA